MGYEERKKLIEETAKLIIDNQYEDRVKYGIDNHFLVDVINKMVKMQAPRIKEFADYIFDNAKDVDDEHSLRCEILMNTEQKSVLTIDDESIYGPNLQHIIVIDDKEHGMLHIRKMRSMDEVKDYKENGYSPFGLSFVNRGFILTFEYMPETFRRLIDHDKRNEEWEKEWLPRLQKIEDMGDNTFHLYECVVYSTGLMASIKNTIEQRKEDVHNNK